mmetsp:Transcript_14705/g.34987  ORF Transcript_14705/g.34987 Transcript_14705/m.34987 type:complete len:471 (+) Transcript_14705:545-1957(+)
MRITLALQEDGNFRSLNLPDNEKIDRVACCHKPVRIQHQCLVCATFIGLDASRDAVVLRMGVEHGVLHVQAASPHVACEQPDALVGGVGLLVLGNDDNGRISNRGFWVLIWRGLQTPSHHDTDVHMVFFRHPVGIAGCVDKPLQVALPDSKIKVERLCAFIQSVQMLFPKEEDATVQADPLPHAIAEHKARVKHRYLCLRPPQEIEGAGDAVADPDEDVVVPRILPVGVRRAHGRALAGSRARPLGGLCLGTCAGCRRRDLADRQRLRRDGMALQEQVERAALLEEGAELRRQRLPSVPGEWLKAGLPVRVGIPPRCPKAVEWLWPRIPPQHRLLEWELERPADGAEGSLGVLRQPLREDDHRRPPPRPQGAVQLAQRREARLAQRRPRDLREGLDDVVGVTQEQHVAATQDALLVKVCLVLRHVLQKQHLFPTGLTERVENRISFVFLGCQKLFTVRPLSTADTQVVCV